MTFRVRACMDAGLLLVSTEVDIWGRYMLEVILGGWGNRRSAIKFLKSATTEVKSDDVIFTRYLSI